MQPGSDPTRRMEDPRRSDGPPAPNPTRALRGTPAPGISGPGTSGPGPQVLGGRYRLDGLLGSGGMADVHRATDLRLHRPVAVKVFRPGTDPDGERRFQAEAQTLANLRHPGLVAVHDVAVQAHRAYLVMELVEGPTLARVLADEQLDVDEIGRIGLELAQVLAYVHGEGVVHRDIKPSNILLDRDGRVRLADFGIAQLVGASGLTSADRSLGTAAYMAPEQVRGEAAGPPTDVYALGLVLLEALTGRVEYPGEGWASADSRLTRSPEIPRSAPEPLRGALAAMTRTDPARRPDTRAVAALLAAGPAAAPPERSGRVGLIALAVVAALVVVLVVVLTGRNASDTATDPAAQTTSEPIAPETTAAPVAPVPAEEIPAEEIPSVDPPADGGGFPALPTGLPALPTELPDLPTALPELPDLPTALPDLPTALPDLPELPSVPQPVQDDARSIWQQISDWWSSLF